MIKNRKLMALLLALVLSFSLLSSGAVFAAAPESGDEETFQILFTSDIHGMMMPYSYALSTATTSSFAQAASVIREAREDFDGQSILLDVGDTIQGNGTGFFMGNSAYKPYPLFLGFNALGYDYFIPGNHEFNFGVPALDMALDGLDAKVLSANILNEDGTNREGWLPYDIKTLESGLRVAVIGLTTPNIELWDTAKLDAAGIIATDAAAECRKIIDKLEAEDAADVYVAAAHMGDEGQYGVSGSGADDLAKLCPELAVIMGGHFHTPTGMKDAQLVLEGSVKFVENKDLGGSVGQVLITATYEDGDWEVKNKTADYASSGVKTDVLPVTADTPIDAATAAVMEGAHEAAIDYTEKTVIGRLEGGPLVPEPEIKGTYEAYLQDTPLIELLNNVMLHYTGADISATAPFSASANMQPGDITIASIVNIYRYDDNTLYTVSMTGRQVVQWMEWCYAYFGSTVGGRTDYTKPAVNPETDLTIPYGTMAGYNFDQFAGINYTVDLTKPAGERIHVSSMADGTSFDLDKSYTVAANNHRATSQLLRTSPTGVFRPGDDTAILLNDSVQNENGSSNIMDLIADYIREQPGGVIRNSCDNNWSIEPIAWDEALRAEAVRLINAGKLETDFKTPVTIDMVKEALEAEGGAWENPFADVSEGDWFYGDVEFVATHEPVLFEGTSETRYSPNAAMTRAMAFTILARLEGVEITGENWIQKAIEFAIPNGISDGTDPTGNVTRRQLATMLYRYAGIGEDGWDGEAMIWAAQNAIINDGRPDDPATRAECAAIFHRFVENAA
jgi:2',3'-cyclic-nucleotide 2'-phosphodiesterase/3'-nucleotidase